MTIDTRTYGNVSRSFLRADWTEADIDFYVQHILPQEVEAEQQTWDQAFDSIAVLDGGADGEATREFMRLNPRPQLAEDHPLPDPRRCAMSPYDDMTDASFR